MFLGTYFHTLDDKGRIAVPSKYRDIIRDKYENSLVMLPFQTCLFVYPETEWLKIIEKVENLPEFDQSKRNFKRLLYSPATEVTMDKQGRILIPQYMRTGIKLEKDAAIIGLNKMFEIWARDRWEEEYRKIQEEYGDLSALRELGV